MFIRRLQRFFLIVMYLSGSDGVLKDDEVITEKQIIDFSRLGNAVYCKFQPYTHQCGHKYPESSHSYDIKMQNCVRTLYGHCQKAYNNFKTRQDCKDSCIDFGMQQLPYTNNLTNSVICRLQPDFGNCHQYHQRYYFDINDLKCKGFGYSGCGGNPNRFSDLRLCQLTCADLITGEDERT